MSILAKPDEGCNISKRGVEERAVYRMRAGTRIAERLQASAIGGDDAEALAVGDMIAASSKPENIWTAEDLHNADGEAHDGYGSFTNAASRLDPAYMKACSARARRRTLDALQAHKPLIGEDQRFITFTIPPVFGFDFERAINLLDAALVLLKKRKWFRSQVAAAVFGDEITTGAKNTHFHCHAHMTGWTRKFAEADLTTLRREWTGCLRAAAKGLGVDALTINTRNGLANVHVRRIIPKERDGKTITLEKAIEETCKYTVKGSDFEAMPVETLRVVERVLRGRKMVRTFRANNRKGRVKQAEYLDHPCTNDGTTAPEAEANDRYEPSDMDDADAARVTGARKIRAEPLRLVGARMIREGKRREWLEMLRFKFAERREWRKAQLAKLFTVATFRTLSGEVWYGVDIVKSRTLSDGVKITQRGEAPSAVRGLWQKPVERLRALHVGLKTFPMPPKACIEAGVQGAAQAPLGQMILPSV
jgi:hypothetical protein